MLTRLRVKGFKNLSDVEVHFGPFTCIAGANAVGKSNLFDAIRFLSLLSDKKLDEAARSIRAEDARNGDVRSLFTNDGQQQYDEMEFDLDMIVPPEAVDDLGQAAEATTTFLNYRLRIGYRHNPEERRTLGELELRSEELNYLKRTDARKHLRFEHTEAWLDSVLRGRRTSSLISTERESDKTFVILHQDGTSRTGVNRRGTGYKRAARQLPRTVLSAGDADSPTVLCAREEMRRWQQLQLEPSAMRESDSINQPPGVTATGAHMAATLYDLGRRPFGTAGKADPEAVYQQVGNRLFELIEGVKKLGVDVDEKREMLTLYLVDKWGGRTHARSLSDGTLSFIALVMKQMETPGQRLLCMEEPENGIHPKRIPVIIRLLLDITAATDAPSDESNPLRQVIINTHSPVVVQHVPEHSVLFADCTPAWRNNGRTFEKLDFKTLPGTWRESFSKPHDVVEKGSLLGYLRSPRPRKNGTEATEPRRVVDNEYVQSVLELS